jgi:hypothetical protein
VNSPLRLLSTNGILEPTQKPPRSPKCNFGKNEFSIENSTQFSLENITNLQIFDFVCNLPHGDQNKSVIGNLKTNVQNLAPGKLSYFDLEILQDLLIAWT